MSPTAADPRPPTRATVTRTARRGLLRRGTWKDRILLLLLLNALPIAALVVIYLRVRRGDATWSEVVPEGVLVNAPYVLAAVVLLSLLVWALLPALGALDRRAWHAVRAAAHRHRTLGALRTLPSLALQPLRLLLAVLLRGVSLLLWIAIALCLALFFVFLLRAVAPQAVDGWLPFTPPDARDWFAR